MTVSQLFPLRIVALAVKVRPVAVLLIDRLCDAGAGPLAPARQAE